MGLSVLDHLALQGVRDSQLLAAETNLQVQQTQVATLTALVDLREKITGWQQYAARLEARVQELTQQLTAERQRADERTQELREMGASQQANLAVRKALRAEAAACPHPEHHPLADLEATRTLHRQVEKAKMEEYVREGVVPTLIK